MPQNYIFCVLSLLPDGEKVPLLDEEASNKLSMVVEALSQHCSQLITGEITLALLHKIDASMSHLRPLYEAMNKKIADSAKFYRALNYAQLCVKQFDEVRKNITAMINKIQTLKQGNVAFPGMRRYQ